MRLKNYYIVLGVPCRETARGIKSAYRYLAKRFHSDRIGEHGTRVLRERNHQGLGNRLLDDFPQDADEPSVECRERLGGLLR